MDKYRYELCASEFFIEAPFKDTYNLEELYKISREVENYDPFLFRYFEDGTNDLTFISEIISQVRRHNRNFKLNYFIPNTVDFEGIMSLRIYFIYIWDMKYRKYIAFAAWPLLNGETLSPQLLWNGKLIDIEGEYG